MRNAWSKKSLQGSEVLAYSATVAAVTFIFALTFGIFDGPDAPHHTMADTVTLVAQSSP